MRKVLAGDGSKVVSNDLALAPTKRQCGTAHMNIAGKSVTDYVVHHEPIISQSNDPEYDSLVGSTALCGHAPSGAYQDRCGYGARPPMLVISQYAKVNYVDHSITDQSSILRFIEDNWAELSNTINNFLLRNLFLFLLG